MAKVEEVPKLSNISNENNSKNNKSMKEECSSDSQEEMGDIYEVQKIVGMSKCDGKVMYKVRWVGYGPAHDTWEPAKNLENTCLDMIEEFQKAKEAAKKRRSDERKRKRALMEGMLDTPEKIDNNKPVRSEDNITDSGKDCTLKDTFWKDLEEGRVNLFESDMYSKVKGRNSRPTSSKTGGDAVKNYTTESTREVAGKKKNVERDKRLEEKSKGRTKEKSENHSSHKSKHKSNSKSEHLHSNDRKGGKDHRKKLNNNEPKCSDRQKHDGNASVDSNSFKNGGASPDSNSNCSSASSHSSFSLSALLEKYKESTVRDTSDCPRVPPLKLKIPADCKAKSQADSLTSKSSKRTSKSGHLECEDSKSKSREKSCIQKEGKDKSSEIFEDNKMTDRLESEDKFSDTGQRQSLFDMFSSSDSTSHKDAIQLTNSKDNRDQIETVEKLSKDSEPMDTKTSNEVKKTFSKESCDKNSATNVDNHDTGCVESSHILNGTPSKTDVLSDVSPNVDSIDQKKNVAPMTNRTQQQLLQRSRPSDSCRNSSPQKKGLYSSDSSSEKSSPNKLGENRKRRYSRTETYRNLKTVRRSGDSDDIYQPPDGLLDDCDIQENEGNDSKDFGFNIQLDDLDWNELEQYSPEPKEISDAELSQATHNGDYSRVRQALKCDKRYDLEQRDSAGKTLVMYAAEKGYDDIVEILVLSSADINARASDGTTAIMLACEQAGICTVAIMIELGANINFRHENGETALMKAVKRGHKQIVKYLLESGANFSDVTSNGYSAITYAKMLKSTDVEDIIADHMSRLKADFDYQVNLTMSKTAKILNALFPVQCFPLSEGPRFKITFNHSLSKCTPGVGYLLFIAHARITSQEIKCRLYGHCATTSVTLNTCQQPSLTEDANFVMSCSPLINGTNELVINTVHAPSSKAKLVVCAYRAELMEPT